MFPTIINIHVLTHELVKTATIGGKKVLPQITIIKESTFGTEVFENLHSLKTPRKNFLRKEHVQETEV